MSFNDRKICHSGEGYVLAICLKMKQGRVFLLILVQCHSGFLVSIEIVMAICTLIAII